MNRQIDQRLVQPICLCKDEPLAALVRECSSGGTDRLSTAASVFSCHVGAASAAIVVPHNVHPPQNLPPDGGVGWGVFEVSSAI